MLTSRRVRVLFQVPGAEPTGGLAIVVELAARLRAAGDSAALVSGASGPARRDGLLLPVRHLRDALDPPPDVVAVASAPQLPEALRACGGTRTRVVLFLLDYDPFVYGTWPAQGEPDVPAALAAALRLPVPALAFGRAVQDLLRTRLGRDAACVPPAFTREPFASAVGDPPPGPRRVLVVGNPRLPVKGVADALQAIRLLGGAQPVLVTREPDAASLRASGVEVHVGPSPPRLAEILRSCHVLCCASRYEGLGLPVLEAWAAGVPAVSTRNHGISGHGVDGGNVLLAEPGSPADLARALRRVLAEPALAARLVEGGRRTLAGAFDWDDTVGSFRRHLVASAAGPPAPVPDDVPEALEDSLVEAGCLTPPAVHETFAAASARLAELERSIRGGDAPVSALRELCDQVRPYAGREGTSYADAFRALLDRGQVLLAFRTDTRALERLRDAR
jgi:glycosyltransferase involved in cell wall biosynthesis